MDFVNLLGYCGVGQEIGKDLLYSVIYQTTDYRGCGHVVKIRVRQTRGVTGPVEVASQES